MLACERVQRSGPSPSPRPESEIVRAQQMPSKSSPVFRSCSGTFGHFRLASLSARPVAPSIPTVCSLRPEACRSQRPDNPFKELQVNSIDAAMTSAKINTNIPALRLPRLKSFAPTPCPTATWRSPKKIQLALDLPNQAPKIVR